MDKLLKELLVLRESGNLGDTDVFNLNFSEIVCTYHGFKHKNDILNDPFLDDGNDIMTKCVICECCFSSYKFEKYCHLRTEEHKKSSERVQQEIRKYGDQMVFNMILLDDMNYIMMKNPELKEHYSVKIDEINKQKYYDPNFENVRIKFKSIMKEMKKNEYNNKTFDDKEKNQYNIYLSAFKNFI